MKNNSFAAAVSKASWKIIYLQLRSRHGRLRVCGRPVPDPSLSCRLGQPGRSEPLRVTADAAAFLRRGTLYCTHIRCQCRRRRGRLAAGPFLSCGRPLSRLRATSSRCAAQPAATARRPPARPGSNPRRTHETKRMCYMRVFSRSLFCFIVSSKPHCARTNGRAPPARSGADIGPTAVRSEGGTRRRSKEAAWRSTRRGECRGCWAAAQEAAPTASCDGGALRSARKQARAIKGQMDARRAGSEGDPT